MKQLQLRFKRTFIYIRPQRQRARVITSMGILEGYSLSSDQRFIVEEVLPLGDEQVNITVGGDPSKSEFRAQTFFQALETRVLGQNLLTTPTLTSTQMFVHQNFGKLPDGLFCVADQQTSGKGRGGNTWTSPKGCLMFTLYKKINIAGQRLPFVQYVVSLAIVQAIHDMSQQYSETSYLDVRIKWPNDIYYKSLKIGGILCQSVYRDGSFHLIVGSGLNVTNAEPTTCLAQIFGSTDENPVKKEDLLAKIANHLEKMLNILCTQGVGPLRDAYLGAWLHTGQQVILEEDQNGKQVRIPLKIKGISDTGYMTAQDTHGETFELHPDGNSLDFFAGLVRRKTK